MALMNAALTPSASIELRAACVVPPLEVTRSRKTAGASSDCIASAVAPAKVACASVRPWLSLRPMSCAACIIASMK